MKTIAVFLGFCLAVLPVAARAYPDRQALQLEIDRLRKSLEQAQGSQGPLCAPHSLADAQTCLAGVLEETQEGDLWEAQDRLEQCRKQADSVLEQIIACNQDADLDQVPNPRDTCPSEPESYNGYRDDDGCPDRMPERATLTADKIEILEPVVFDEKSNQPTASSQPVLAEVARVLRENPQIRIRVEVHLDEGLADDEALRVSSVRSANLKSWLESLGVPGNRLLSSGKGNQEPIAPGDSSFGRQLNQRVEFVKID